MEWWSNLVDWFGSEDGRLIVLGAIIPFVAIVVAGIVAASIGRAAVRRLVGQRERETRAAAVAALIAAGQSATSWHTQPPQTREHFERLASQADVQVRLLPLTGASLAADWAAHELADMRTNSVSFSFQADQTLGEYRDRLVEWLHKPSKARKLFAADLDRWRYDEPAQVDPVVLQQQKWAEEQFTAATHTTPERSAERALPATSDSGETPTAVAPTSTVRNGTAPTGTASTSTASTGTAPNSTTSSSTSAADRDAAARDDDDAESRADAHR